MNNKHANRLFLILVIVYFVLILGLSFAVAKYGLNVELLSSNAFLEFGLLIPTFIYVLCVRDDIFELVSLKKIKLATFFLVPLYVLCLFPLITILNSISMIFVDNVVASSTADILQVPFLISVFQIGIFAPLCEEIIFRGVFYHSYRRSGTALTSAIISGILFGIIHMNINQAMYAIAIGFFFALLVEVTGSTLTSFWAHAFFNSSEVGLIYITQSLATNLGNTNMQNIIEMENDLSKEALLQTVVVMLPAAAALVAVVILIAFLISKVEGNTDKFKEFFKIEKPQTFYTPDGRIVQRAKPTMITPSLVIGVILALIYMVITAI
ncbi:MAG: CPBP family intramembrane metalloprotease [Butyrivibrio sp.]|nr:CPBP family intramembrane metalloprotease [Butyrivibrio sp.]